MAQESGTWFTSLIGSPPGYLNMVPMGYVLALDPGSSQVVPHSVGQGYDPLGVLKDDVILDWDYGTLEVPVIMRGDVIEKYCWDNHEYGKVLASTKELLGDRIKFV